MYSKRYSKKEAHGPLFSLQISQEGLILIHSEYEKVTLFHYVKHFVL